MPHTYINCLAHYVFSTKGRANLIPREVLPRLWAYLGGIARENAMKALAVGGTQNHVHMLVSLPATLSLSKAIQLIKGGSSKWLHDTFPACESFAWQEGYGAFTIGISAVADTIDYIARQDEHHRTRTFEEEFIAFLKRHDMEYDERFVWG